MFLQLLAHAPQSSALATAALSLSLARASASLLAAMSIHRDQSTVDEDASLGRAGLGPEWQNAHPLWNAEVLLILQHHQTAQAKDEAAGVARAQSSAQTQHRLQQTLQYVRALNNYHSQAAVDEAMGLLDQYPALDKWELSLLNNLKIDDLDECLTLLPTLKAKKEEGKIEAEQIQRILDDLKRYQTTT